MHIGGILDVDPADIPSAEKALRAVLAPIGKVLAVTVRARDEVRDGKRLVSWALATLADAKGTQDTLDALQPGREEHGGLVAKPVDVVQAIVSTGSMGKVMRKHQTKIDGLVTAVAAFQSGTVAQRNDVRDKFRRAMQLAPNLRLAKLPRAVKLSEVVVSSVDFDRSNPALNGSAIGPAAQPLHDSTLPNGMATPGRTIAPPKSMLQIIGCTCMNADDEPPGWGGGYEEYHFEQDSMAAVGAPVATVSKNAAPVAKVSKNAAQSKMGAAIP